MLLSRTISCCKILQLKFFCVTLSNFKLKVRITGTLTIRHYRMLIEYIKPPGSVCDTYFMSWCFCKHVR